MNNLRIAAPSRRQLLKTAAVLPLCTGGLLAACTKKVSVSETAMLELGAREAVDHIRKGDMTAEAYVQTLLKQYVAHKDLNAVVFIEESRVLEGARAVDQARTRGETLPAAAGLPFAVKDQIAVAGWPATGGSAPLKGYVPKENAAVVEAVVRAGGIVFAKTNLPDMVGGTGNLAKSAAIDNPYFGATHNPYDPSRVTGGSSGGNGAAVAARMVPAAIGEDTGGSVRFPAALCGIAGLRPSTFTIGNAIAGEIHKRYSDKGIIIPPAGPRDTFGPMARTVSDVAFLDQIITGEISPPIPLKDARLGVPRADYWAQDHIDRGVAKVMQEALGKLRQAGAALVEIDFEAVRALASEKLDQALRMPNLQAKNLEQWLAENLPGVSVDEVTKGRSVGVPDAAPLDPVERARILQGAIAGYTEVFANNGVMAIVFPTIPIPAPPLNPQGETMEETILINGKPINKVQAMIPNIFFGPRIGAPGLAIPAGLTDGMPVGLELEGLPGTDTQLLGLGMSVQEALGRIPGPTFQAARVG